MMKFIVTMLMSVMLFGCAAKATTPSLADQFSDHVRAVEADHTAMAQKNATQDARLDAVEAKLDRAFRKSN